MRYVYLIVLIGGLSCKPTPRQEQGGSADTVFHSVVDTADRFSSDSIAKAINTDSTQGERMVAFAKTLIGKPYVYGCKAPATGFDCSGFINYVFDHFNIAVPRSSVDFTNAGTTMPLAQARAGDLILFTGTNPSIRTVGHIGMIVTNDGSGTTFIHASSGKEMAVTITPLNERYKVRFVKVVRIQ